MRIGTGLTVAALAACMGAPSQAQTFEEGIPAELARAFISPGNAGGIEFHQGFPPDFPDIDLPSEVSVMGSMEQGSAERVVLHAPPDAGQQREALVEAMEADGYRMITRPPQPDPNQRGFVAPAVIPPGMALQLCHDDHGTVTLHVVRGSVEPLIVMMGTRVQRQMQMSCEQQEARMELMGRRGPGGRGAQQYMPRLELPPESASGRGAGALFSPFGMSSSGTNTRTSTAVSVDWSPDRLHEHFATQLREQDWTVDSESAGTLSASSGWLAEQDDESLLGSLQILSSGDGQYQVTFVLSVLPE